MTRRDMFRFRFEAIISRLLLFAALGSPSFATAQPAVRLPSRTGEPPEQVESSVTSRSEASLPSSASIVPSTRSDGNAAEATAWEDTEWTPEERRNIRVYELTNRSVVNITTRTLRPDFPFFADVAEGSGSGSVLDKDGHILTNLHVIEGAREIRVTLHTGNTYDADLVGQDPLNDIAVLRIRAPQSDLLPLVFGDATRLRVGQRIYAIGNPFGLERTLTTGIISSLNRTLPAQDDRRMKAIIQIDAALNRGNSGGPLLNSRAELIGMNTAIASSTGENTGVGFAIPISTIQRVVPQLIKNGHVIRPETGIVAVQTDRGLVVARLQPGGPGERAGLQGFRVIREQMQRGPYLYERTRIDQSAADEIIAVEGTPVKSRDDFFSLIEQRSPGDSVQLTIRRQGQPLELIMELEQAAVR
jgi:S1-C subfamily serine protease